jgi:hypothetical protein
MKTIFKRPENMDKKLYYLIITSFTMDKEEKKEWLDLYNEMDKDQLNRLYNSEIRDMNLKHLLEWQK